MSDQQIRRVNEQCIIMCITYIVSVSEVMHITPETERILVLLKDSLSHKLTYLCIFALHCQSCSQKSKTVKTDLQINVQKPRVKAALKL